MNSFLHRKSDIGSKRRRSVCCIGTEGPARRPAVAVTPAISRGAMAVGAFALGALSVGAVAFGAVAIGRMVIGRFHIRKARIDQLEIGTLKAGSIEIAEPLKQQDSNGPSDS